MRFLIFFIAFIVIYLFFFCYFFLKGLDFAIYEAGKNKIKLILSLVNNYNDFGGKKQYVDWAKSQGQYLTSEDDFFTNSVVKGYFKNHIKVCCRNKILCLDSR